MYAKLLTTAKGYTSKDFKVLIHEGPKNKTVHGNEDVSHLFFTF